MRKRKMIEGELHRPITKSGIENRIKIELLLDIRELLLKACNAQGVQAKAIETISQQKIDPRVLKKL